MPNEPAVSRGITVVTSLGFVACIVNVTPPNITRDSLDISCQTTVGAMQFIPAWLYDGGELQLLIQLDPEMTPTIITDAPANETVTVTFPDGTGEWEFLGHMNQYTPTADLGAVMQSTVAWKVSDDLSIVTTS